jgi:hypothetical protein
VGSFGSNEGDSARTAALIIVCETGMIDPTMRPRITSARRVIFLVMIVSVLNATYTDSRYATTACIWSRVKSLMTPCITGAVRSTL